ncbi:DegT/DnrJ/EryC1/StrS family aminotransferase [Nonomuraea sediminis]|uniref:DegT/DnrJ/EryC1/StrS family aminotransferase n=1 Tax=Nonomuraea sediminis TaxID=2835864 RepID=UPI001BDCCF6D|nr:DegT/DnrJ/EryC1/StrS aminotransferase family protein [Nonomuraea sediminis]
MLTVPYFVPSFAGDASAAVLEVMESGWVTTGPRAAAFEEEFAAYLGAAHVVAVSTCSAAIELSLRALALPPGSAVLTPSLTFCSAVGAIINARLRPVLIDIDEHTLVPTPDTVAAAVRRAGKPAAMVVTHMAGYPVDAKELAAAAGLPRERVVEDVAHGPGGLLRGAPIGSDSYAACFSFYATKNLPIGEGGAVATYDAELAARLRAMRLHGMTKDAWKRYLPGGSWRYDVAELGMKANFTDLQAVIGSAQLRALPGMQARRHELAARYDAALAGLPGLRLPQRPANGHSWHLYQVRLRDRTTVDVALGEAGIGTSVHFIPVHQLTAYAKALGPQECASVPATDRVAEELLSLPLYPALSDEKQDLVISALAEALDGRPC